MDSKGPPVDVSSVPFQVSCRSAINVLVTVVFPTCSCTVTYINDTYDFPTNELILEGLLINGSAQVAVCKIGMLSQRMALAHMMYSLMDVIYDVVIHPESIEYSTFEAFKAISSLATPEAWALMLALVAWTSLLLFLNGYLLSQSADVKTLFFKTIRLVAVAVGQGKGVWGFLPMLPVLILHILLQLMILSKTCGSAKVIVLV